MNSARVREKSGSLALSFGKKIAVALLLLLCAALAPIAAAQKSAALFPISGKVINAVTGEPLSGASLLLIGISGVKPIAEARSNSEGHFQLSGVAAGKYRLLAARIGFTTSFYEQHGDFSSAIVTGPGEETGELLFRLPPQAVLRGTVTDDAGEPVAGARVKLFRKPGSAETGNLTYTPATETTDDAGFYEFARLSPGDYLLAVLAEPWYALYGKNSAGERVSALDQVYPITYFDSTTDEASALPIHLGPGNHFEANFNLHAVPALHFTLPESSAKALPALRKSIFGQIENAPPGDVGTNAQGETEIQGVAPGHYEIVSGNPAQSLSIDLTESSALNPAAGTPAAALRGTVETAPGVVFSEAYQLILFPAGSSSRERERRVPVRNGKFGIRDVPAGSWTIGLIDDSGFSLSVEAIAVGKHKLAGKMLPTSGQPLEITVTVQPNLQTIQGFAKNEGKGVAGAMIVLIPEDPSLFPAQVRRDQSDSDGSFMLPHVAPGRYRLIALTNAWERDWSRPEAFAGYLSGGQSVTVSTGARETTQLAEPVAVQTAQ